MTGRPRHVVIVGGGTAGWLAALILTDAAAKAGAQTAFTVIESSKFGTVGVGEGTTAVFRQMLKHFGIDEEAFLAATGATIKYGIRHRDWRRLGHQYDGPIDLPEGVAGPGLDLYAVAAGKPVAAAHLFQYLMNLKRAPVARRQGRNVPAGPFHYAFHFDQSLAGKFLKTQARGVELIDDQVTAVETGEHGITALTLESGRQVAGDFFIDATGFRRALISQLGGTWVSYGDVLPVNRAMPFWVDLDEGEEIDPFTLAWAQKNGWMWRIPTQGRYGCGYVYSDAHTDPDAARAEIEATLGCAIEPRNDIRIDAGRLDRNWIGNCVAIGLSSSFLEPLEATSIHGTVVQLLLLAATMDKPGARDAFNATVARQVDDFRDFIRLHYVGERRDSAFWRDVAASHPQAVRDRLAQWRTRPPVPADFTALPMGLPHVGQELYMPVLDGLGLLDRASAKAALAGDPKRRAALRKTHDGLISEYRKAARQCLPHRAYLQSVTQRNAA